MVKFCSLAFGVFCVLGVSHAQYNPIARIFDKQGCNGDSLTISTGEYIPDLAVHKFDNRAQSASLRGAWIFYGDKDFNLNKDAAVEWFFEDAEKCVDFKFVGGIVSSIKFAGTSSEYVRQETLTLFERTNFQGNNEEYIDLDTSKFDWINRVGSLIITGSSPWTIYDKPNFGGNSICLYENEPAFVPDPSHLIRRGASVKKGCHMKKVARIAGYTSTGNHSNKSVEIISQAHNKESPQNKEVYPAC